MQRRTSFALSMTGVALVAAGCSSSSTPTPEVTVTETEAPSAAATPTAPATAPTGGDTTQARAAGALPAKLAGAKKLSGATAGDSEYARYSTSMPPKRVVAKVKKEATNAGYTVKNSGGSGGGWGGWGGSNYGMTATKDGSYLAVQAGGESGSTTYFEVCVGAKDSEAMRHCEDRSNEDSRSSGS